MNMFKKEWKSIVIVVWLAGITLLLFNIQGKLDPIQARGDQIADNLETVEGVILGTDSGVLEIDKRMERLESQVNYIAKRVRRR